MPWSSGYQTDVPGIGEARLDAWLALLTDATRLANLNTVLALSPNLGITASSSNFIIGDPDSWPPGGPQTFLVCVCGGGKNDTLDMEPSIKTSGVPFTVSSFRIEIHTQFMVYVHGDAFAQSATTWATVKTQVEKRERLRQRLCDWIRAAVLMTTEGVTLTLGSHEYSASGDEMGPLPGPYIRIDQGRYDKGFGGQFGVVGAQIRIGNYVQ